tara:strand:- start:29268 stop:29693 length:426 start_codon:yes stop_codon:yes gene_type:complete
MDNRKLTTKQQRFVDFYDGNGVDACRKAGYKGNDDTLRSIASENLTKPNIVKAIQTREQQSKESLILDREALQTFWSSSVLSETLDMSTRLRASELLGKSQGVFIDRHEHSGNIEIDKYKEQLKSEVDAHILSIYGSEAVN